MLRAGSICASFLYTYLTSEIKEDEIENCDENFKKKKLQMKCLSEVFANSGGVLSKIAQMMNIDSGEHDNQVFSDCKPFNKEKTTQYLSEIVNTKFRDQIIHFDTEVFKSGSIGQVHRAKTVLGEDIVMKVQYYGLLEQFDTDVKILNNVAYFLYYGKNSKNMLKDALVDIKDKLYEELDYENEVKNHKKFYNIWKDDENIKVAKLYEHLCTDKIITMEFIEGEILSSYLETASLEDKNFICENIFDFIFINLFHKKLFYIDIHYGNFLINDKKQIYIMDFGCIENVEDELLHNLKLLLKSLIDDDKDMFYILMEEIGVLTNEIKEEKLIKHMYSKMKDLLEPMITETIFVFKDEWYEKVSSYDKESQSWVLPPNLVHFSKIPFGLFALFVKMKVEINLCERIKKILKF